VTYRDLALKARTGAGWCAALLGFAIPVSTAFDGTLVVMLVFAWIIALPVSFREWGRTCLQVRPALVALLLFCALSIACLYSPASWKGAWSSLSKYLDLALIAVFAWAAATRTVRRRALYAYLAAVALSLLVSYGTVIGLWERLPGLYTKAEYPIGFRLSVTHNLLVSLGAFASLLIARELRRERPAAAAVMLALALACIFNVLFIVIGRTGYVVLAALLVYFSCTIARSRRTALVAVLVMTTLFASAYLGSQYFGDRMQDIASDLTQWKPGEKDETSVGQRIGYHRTTLEIIREHPLSGVGTGGFSQAFADKVRGTPARATTNPHNDYLMIAAQAGLPALALLIALYVVIWREAPRLASTLERDLVRGLLLTIAIGGLFNTLLMDHVEGLLFAWATGLLFACRDDRPREV